MRSDCLHGINADWCAECRPRALTGKAKWAEQVFDFIPDIAGDWSSADELAELSGLTVGQVGDAVAYLRENYPQFPLISSTRGYRFSIDEAEITRFRRWRARSARTIVRRLWRGAIKPYVERTAQPEVSRLVTKQFERLLEDIEEIVA